MKKEQKITTNIKAHNQNLAVLKKHFSHCFTKSGGFDVEKFKAELSTDEIDFYKESYGIDWLGKSYARLLAADEATTLLVEDEEFNAQDNNKNSENLLIKGDNLEVLKHLSNAYYEKIKMIYIDPPYNTGGDDFIYQDDRKFTVGELQQLIGIDEDKAKRILAFTASKSNSHSAWLTFMYPRLYIAKQLLRDDGVIFISIDDNEVAQLKMICDEVFGEDNFVSSLIWQKKTGASDSISISTITENIFVYSKNILFSDDTFSKNKDSYNLSRYKLHDKHLKKRGVYYTDNLDRGGLQYSDSLNFGIKCPDGTIAYPNGRNEFYNDGWIWKWSKAKIEWAIKNDFIHFKKSNKKKCGWSVLYKNYLNVDNNNDQIKKSAPHKNLIQSILNASSAADMKALFKEGVFSYPKPVNLIKHLIKFVKLNKNDLILDFFAGSGTTADAIMQLNAEDGGNRKYILVQLPEKIDPKKNKTSYDFVKDELGKEPTIFEITKERLIRAADKIQQEQKTNKDLFAQNKIQDLGFKIFATMPIWKDYNFESNELEPQQTILFDESKLSKDDIKALLVTWKTFDGIPLTEDLQEIDLDGYTASYASGKLYLTNRGFTTANLKTLLEKIDNDKNFSPNIIIAFGYYFESKSLREIAENIKSYANKKNIDIDFIIRY